MEAVTRHGGMVPLLLPDTVQEQVAARRNQSQNAAGLMDHEMQGRPLCSPRPPPASGETAQLGARLVFGFSFRYQDATLKPARREEPQMNGACEQQ